MGNRPPLSYTGPRGELRGLAVDLARMLNRGLGRETVLIEGTIPELKAMLEVGTIDYISCILMNDPAEVELRYIPTSFSMNRRILVANRDIHITSEEEFAGRTLVLVENDSFYRPVAERAGARVVMAHNTPDALAVLERGGADALVTSFGEVAVSMVQLTGKSDIALMGPSLARQPISLAMDRQREALASRLAGVLTNLEHAGTLEELRETWLGKPIVADQPIWVRYRTFILYGLGLVAAFLVFSVSWTFMLRRKVSAVTRDLRISETRYRELTEASPDAVLLLDSQGQVRFSNRSARWLFGDGTDLPPGSLLGALTEGDEGKIGLSGLLGQALSGRVARGELMAHPGGDRAVPLEIIAFRATTESGWLVCCMARDLSARRTMERELMRVDRLAVIGRMAAGVAHEINNPLGIIQANTEYMLKKGAGPQQLEAVRRNVERAAGITRRLLHLAVPADMETVSLDLVDVVRECLAFLKPRLTGVDVELHLPASMPVQGDQGLLEQLLLNLLLNALDGMKDCGRLRLSGRLDRRPGGEPGIRLEVEDSGPGIPRQDLERVFEPFYSTKGGQGFGLGLFLARSIAELHHGLLFAESGAAGAGLILELPCGHGG